MNKLWDCAPLGICKDLLYSTCPVGHCWAHGINKSCIYIIFLNTQLASCSLSRNVSQILLNQLDLLFKNLTQADRQKVPEEWNGIIFFRFYVFTGTGNIPRVERIAVVLGRGRHRSYLGGRELQTHAIAHLFPLVASNPHMAGGTSA